MTNHTFRPAWFAPGPHLQTLWGKLVRRRLPLALRRERWDTPDGDFLDLHRLDAPAGSPRLLLLHGLEGSARSHYVGGTFAEAQCRGWGADLLVFRSCGDEPNRAARFYHSGETTDLAFAVERIAREHPGSPLLVAGVSLGANVLLKWLGEQGSALPHQVCAAAAVSTPFDLARSARHIDRGFARVYQGNFLRSLRRKALAKLERFPGLFDRAALERARTLYDFDDVVTAPVHGFEGAEHYYASSSALRFLAGIRVPTLLLNAMDDPFLPAEVLDAARRVAAANPALEVEFPPHGGHVGFVGGWLPWRPLYYAEWRVVDFLARQLEAQSEPRRRVG